ncbi:MAG: hypothetical protein BWY67_01305 [Bacteroidetes bacterium ADurb.Bin397]|nr:MAG: hypothetical protein BWY67_01305 [Bacteroidetes bacterium ADurb.Bin397]
MISKLFVPLIPDKVGNVLLQFNTVIWISRSTVPISTPFLYSETRTAITVTSRFCGVMQISPVAGLNDTAGEDVSGSVALNGGI